MFTDLAGVIADGTLDASRTWFALGVTVLMLVMLPYAYHLDKKSRTQLAAMPSAAEGAGLLL